MMTYATDFKNGQWMTRINSLLRMFNNAGNSLSASRIWKAIFVSDFSYFQVSWLELWRRPVYRGMT